MMKRTLSLLLALVLCLPLFSVSALADTSRPSDRYLPDAGHDPARSAESRGESQRAHDPGNQCGSRIQGRLRV